MTRGGPRLLLNDGRSMPQLGLGVWQTPADDTARLVAEAIGMGYRSIDTAMIYGNERGVGEGVRASGVPREELFVTTKLWNAHQARDLAVRALDKSLARLGLDYVDLYLIHWPAPALDLYMDAWKALTWLRDSGRARSIGVSNFCVPHLERLVGESGVVPALNQIELHPYFQQTELRAWHAAHGMLTESWSPLGRGPVLEEPVVGHVARKHYRTPAQTVLRWHLQQGLVAIPKSRTPGRIAENFDVFDFELDAEDMAALARLDRPRGRIGNDPMLMNVT